MIDAEKVKIYDKVIDWRLRPPYKSFKANKIFNDPLYHSALHHSAASIHFSMDLLMDEMEANNVKWGVVPFRGGQDLNDINELAEKYSHCLKFMAHIDPYCADPAGEIDKWIINGKADLATVEPGQTFIKKSIKADDKIMWPIYEKCQKEDVVINICFGGQYSHSLELYKPDEIDNIAKMFPDLKMVLAHGGWPYVDEICEVADKHKNIYLSPDFYLMPVNPGYEKYAAAANGSLQDRIIFGSTYPGFRLDLSIEYVKNSGVKPEILEKVFYTNAAKLLKIED